MLENLDHGELRTMCNTETSKSDQYRPHDLSELELAEKAGMLRTKADGSVEIK